MPKFIRLRPDQIINPAYIVSAELVAPSENIAELHVRLLIRGIGTICVDGEAGRAIWDELNGKPPESEPEQEELAEGRAI